MEGYIMSNFNLEDYETVKERKKKWYALFPNGSLVTEIIFHEKGHVIIKGLAFKTKEDQEKNLPTGVGYAEEFQGQGGFANKFAWMENCDESAIGRALDNAGFSGNNKCSKEEIQKVKNKTEEKREKVPGQNILVGDFFMNLPDPVKKFVKSKKYTSNQLYDFCKEHNWCIDSIVAAVIMIQEKDKVEVLKNVNAAATMPQEQKKNKDN
jgi:hypothetical protein